MNTSFSTNILASTLDHYERTFTDSIILNCALTFRLKEKGCIKAIDGGDYIRENIMYLKNTNVGSYSGLETLPLSAQDVFTAAQFTWKELYATMTLSELDKNKNSSSQSRIFDLIEGLIQNAELSLKQEFNRQIFTDGTGNNSKDITGLKAMVSATGTYAGIAKGTYAYWQSYVEATSEALSLAKMRTAHTTATKGLTAGRPDLIITTDTLLNAYEALNTPFLRYENAKLADAGFANLRFKSSDMVFDENCDTGYMYFLCTPMIKLVHHKDAFFKALPPVRPNDQTGETIIIRFMGNLVTKACKKHSLLTGKTA